MLSKWLGGLALAAAVFFSAPALAAGELTNEQKEQFGKFIHDYLLSHPEVIKDSVEELDRREKAEEMADREKTVTNEASKLFRSPNQAVVGNPDGDVTIVEFFDYNCGYCKQSLANVTKLIESDPKLRVILKDFAILGPDSVEVAEVATAARQQLKGPKFWEFHKKLLGTRGHIGKAQAVADRQGARGGPGSAREGHQEPGDARHASPRSRRSPRSCISAERRPGSSARTPLSAACPIRT